jgi:hypothetical protein
MNNAKLIAKTVLAVKEIEIPNRDAEILALAYLELLDEKNMLNEVLKYYLPSKIDKEAV